MQSGNTYPVSALIGNESAPAFYSYNTPAQTSANTGLEIPNTFVLFLYEDLNTGVVSLFMIADTANDDSAGSLEADINCLPASAFISVEDDVGEITGAPPIISANWGWNLCCTDGGVIEDVGCGNAFNVDLLVSSGIDSIIWLTGDISNPTPILLSMNGDYIVVDCGGGFCCPSDFDTEVITIPATCSDTPNGAIDINPTEGESPFVYSWSTGANSQDIMNLLPGMYQVTITDAAGCTEEIEIEVTTSPGDPPAASAEIMLCSDNSTESFDLTSVENIITQGFVGDVLWFENADLTGAILNPSNYLTGSTTVYAVVDNGSCQSDPVSVVLEVIPRPDAMSVTLHACEEQNAMATFDLTEISDQVSGGAGSVSFYLDPGLSNPIADPTAFMSFSTTIYAVVNDGTCLSEPAEVDLIVDPKPDAVGATMSLCGDEFNEAVFDLTSVDNIVSGGAGMVEWYQDMALTLPIADPTQYMTGSTTIYAAVFDGTCLSEPVAVFLVVEETPTAEAVFAEMCDDGTGQATFDLWDYAGQISGGQGGVDWYFDILLIEQIPFPDVFLTTSIIIYATVNSGICVSDPVEVVLEVIQSPTGSPTFIETCADSTGQGVFNLITAEMDVNGGNGAITWYEDAQGNIEIDNPTMFVSSGTAVYAQISDGVCVSEFIPVDLLIVNTVSASPATYAICDDGTGIGTFDLTSIEPAVSNGTGQVNWFWDNGGTIPITVPDSLVLGDTVVYAHVTAGTCTSEIVAVELLTLLTPEAMSTALQLCGDTSAQVVIDLTELDALIGGGIGDVIWYGDIALTQQIAEPSMFETGDTILYAIVEIGSCISQPATIVLFVAEAVGADPVSIELCVPEGDTVIVDLTLSDGMISGGTGQVNWFFDPAGNIQIVSPANYPGTDSVTLYAQVTAGICSSVVVPIDIVVLTEPEGTPFTLKKCGDLTGQVSFDLTMSESFVSGGIGSVTWFGDSDTSMQILNASGFVSGDSVVYAVVTNGFCQSDIIPVTLDVVDSLTANSIELQQCVIGADSATIDLTLSDFDISGGNGIVYWFSDALTTDTIQNPEQFVTSGDTLYAIVTADGCISDPAVIAIEVSSSEYPEPACVFGSIDSIAVEWPGVASEYELIYAVNNQMAGGPMTTAQNNFSLGGLGQADTVTLWVTAMFDSVCAPLTSMITCITDVCPAQTLEFIGLETAYCSEVPYIVLVATPADGTFSGEGISGDTLYPGSVTSGTTMVMYSWADISTGCLYADALVVEIFEPLSPPSLTCGMPTLATVLFDLGSAGSYEYQYSVNAGSLSGIMMTNADSLLFDNLSEGDEITLFLWSVGSGPCGNSDTVTVTCITEQCPGATITITDPEPVCSEDDTLLLEAVIAGLPGQPDISWSGNGIIDPSGIFDPVIAEAGVHEVTVTVTDGGCVYSESVNVHVLLQPIALFEVSGTPCTDSILHVTFTGEAFGNSDFNWDLDGGNVVSGNFPVDFSVQWPEPGEHLLNLQIDWNICSSEPFELPVQIDAPLDTPVVFCIDEDYHSITIGWEPVADATGYTVTSSRGIGVQTGQTFTVTNLPDNTLIDITVVAHGVSTCGPVSTIIECQTLEVIPVVTFVPNLFSPNHDGINDILYVHANSEVLKVHTFRIFDRWGAVVFEDSDFPPNDPAHGWDGTLNGEVLNPGVFVYYIELETTGDEPEVVYGDVTLIR